MLSERNQCNFPYLWLGIVVGVVCLSWYLLVFPQPPAGELRLAHYLQQPQVHIDFFIMRTLSLSVDGLMVLLAGLTVWLAINRYMLEAFYVLITLGSQGLAELLKMIFHRARPIYPLLLEPAHFSGFGLPSGHALMSVVLSFSLGAIWLRFWPNSARWMIWLGVGLYCFLVGWSRIYLGAHYPSDVVAGWIIGSLLTLFYWQIYQCFSRIKNDPLGVNAPGDL